MAVRDDGPQIRRLDDGRRLHLQHGPIDLIIGADGATREVELAYRQVAEFFQDVLAALVGELDVLRRSCASDMPIAEGAIARHMQTTACALGETVFVTPMIAVAGAVADHAMRALHDGRDLQRAYVNNGGDIALALTPGTAFDIGVCSNPETGAHTAKVRIEHGSGIGGIATSGWRGRSLSLGIADAVTVLAVDAASADVAATLIANAVDVPGSPCIQRARATQVSPDSDLGDRFVTVDVAELSNDEVRSALNCGQVVAEKMIAGQHIQGAYLALRDQSLSCGGELQLSTSMHETNVMATARADAHRRLSAVKT